MLSFQNLEVFRKKNHGFFKFSNIRLNCSIYSHNQEDPELIDSYSNDFTYRVSHKAWEFSKQIFDIVFLNNSLI